MWCAGMIVTNILESFLRATRGSSGSETQEGSGDTSSGGGLSYHDIGMANAILVPDAFSYH